MPGRGSKAGSTATQPSRRGIQLLFAVGVPLVVIPLGLVSLPLAVVFAFVLILIILSPVAGPSQIAAAFIMAAFATVPFNAVVPIAALPWMEISDPFFIVALVLLIPHFLRTPLTLPLAFVVGSIGFVAIGVLSAIGTDIPGANIAYLVDVVRGVILLPLFMTWWKPDRRIMVGVALAYMTGTLINVIAATIQGEYPRIRADGLSSHPNVYAFCAVMSLALVPFLLAMLDQRHHAIVRVLALAAVYAVWTSGSRGAFFCMVILACCYPLLRRSIASGLAVGATALVAFAVLHRFAQSVSPTSALGRVFGGDQATESTNIRIGAAEIGIKQFLAHPVLGDGWVGVWGIHVSFLEVAAAMGVLGLIFYVTVLWSLLRPVFFVPSPYGLLAVPVLAAIVLDLVLPLIGARMVWCVLALSLSAQRLWEENRAVDDVPTAPPLESLKPR